MTRPSRAIAFIGVLGLVVCAACSPTNLPANIGPTVQQVNRIVNDSDLTPQEKRESLRALGIDDVTINGLLVAERLGNQFGGDLESAYLKVVGRRLNEMTPDEIQFYGDATDETTYGDTEAQQIADFFVAAGITSQASLADYLENDSLEVPPLIDRDILEAVFVTFNSGDILDQLP